ncbi:MAG: hypothetical protein OHK0039_33290 [Bacteroidia bacterium]
MLLLTGQFALAQRTHAISAGVGTIYYYGDLTDRFNNSLLRPAGSISYSKYFLASTSFRASIGYGEIGATDIMALDNPRRVRNLHFKSHLLEVGAVVVHEFIRDKNFGNSWQGKPHFSPLVFAGVTMFHYNPKARYEGVWYDLKPLGTEGQGLPGSQLTPYSLLQVSVPLGGGVSIRLSEYAGVNVEVGYRLTMTDYLDDVSTVYPDFGLLAEYRGPLAVELSERSADNRFNPGDQRGNAGANDGYFFTMVSVTYYLSKFASRN